MRNILNILREEFASIWALLNDTEVFMRRIGKDEEYEFEFKVWRANIILHQSNGDILRDIRSEIAELRAALRREGYDLKLGSRDLQIRSFVHDDAPKYGYRRLTLSITKSDVLYITGEANHQELYRLLARRYGFEPEALPGDIHHLWYRWNDNVLQICGADSESHDDYERFGEFAAKHKIFLLKKFHNI